jgi:DNA-damage-inducible protein J
MEVPVMANISLRAPRGSLGDVAREAGSINILLDGDVKTRFEKFCRTVGMEPTTAISLFVNAVVREQRIPFEISASRGDPFYSDANQKFLLESIAQLDRGEGRQFDDVGEIFTSRS